MEVTPDDDLSSVPGLVRGALSACGAWDASGATHPNLAALVQVREKLSDAAEAAARTRARRHIPASRVSRTAGSAVAPTHSQCVGRAPPLQSCTSARSEPSGWLGQQTVVGHLEERAWPPLVLRSDARVLSLSRLCSEWIRRPWYRVRAQKG